MTPLEDLLRRRLETAGSLTLEIRARPGARATRLVGEMADGSLKMDVAAAPEDGKANVELARFLAALFGANVELLSGQTSRLKRVRVSAV